MSNIERNYRGEKVSRQSEYQADGEIQPKIMVQEEELLPSNEIGRQIIITPLNYGYSVTVGCQTLAIEDLGKLIDNLQSYLQNPSKYERGWSKTKKLI